MTTLAETMETERTRLNNTLADIVAKRAELDQQERSTRIELAGIQAYLDAKMGKVMTPTTKGRSTVQRGPRKAGIRQQVLDLITADGISKQDILSKMNATDDKTLQQAISNSLVALKKDGKVISGERGAYKLPDAAPTHTAPTDEPPAPTGKRVKKTDTPATV
jgi:hypothetical protein